MWWKKKEKHYLYLTREELRVVMTSLVHCKNKLIREGRLNEETLMRIGKDGAWLNAQLRKQGCKSEKEVFLGVCDQNNGLIVYKKV